MKQRILTVAILFSFPIFASFFAAAVYLDLREGRRWWPDAIVPPVAVWMWWSTLRGNAELQRHRGYIDGLTRAVDLQREKRARA